MAEDDQERVRAKQRWASDMAQAQPGAMADAVSVVEHHPDDGTRPPLRALRRRVDLVIRGWRCRRRGHQWAGIGPLEHICVRDWCWRCGAVRWVHLTGPWPHTCGQPASSQAV